MHVNLELQEDAFGYKKGEIIPALKDHIGYILFEEDHTRIYIENDNEYVKEVDYIKKVRHKSTGDIIEVIIEDDSEYFFKTVFISVNLYHERKKDCEEIEERTVEVIHYEQGISNVMLANEKEKNKKLKEELKVTKKKLEEMLVDYWGTPHIVVDFDIANRNNFGGYFMEKGKLPQLQKEVKEHVDDLISHLIKVCVLKEEN